MTLVWGAMQATFAQTLGQPSIFDRPDSFDDTRSPTFRTGIAAGRFLLYPTAGLTLGYDSNILADDAATESGAVAIAQSSLRTRYSSNELDFDGTADVRRRWYPDSSDQDATDLSIAAAWHSPQSSRTGWGLDLAAVRAAESRFDREAPESRQVSYVQQLGGGVSYGRVFNRLSIAANAAAQRFSYDEADQAFRDRWAYRSEVRAGYAPANRLSAIGTLYVSRDDYDQDAFGVVSADSAGALLGARLDVPELYTFELEAGYFHRSLAEDRGSISGLSARGRMTWYITRLTTLKAELNRQDEPTRVLGAFGKIRTEGVVEIQHALAWNAMLHLRGQLIQDEFKLASQSDTNYLIDTGLDYLISRLCVIKFEYGYSSRSSTAANDEFSRHMVGISVMLRL